MLKYILSAVVFVVCFSSFGYTQAQRLPSNFSEILEKKFQSWKLAEIQPEIVGYFKGQRPHEQPNFISGDWNGDQKKDYAALLESRSNSAKRIILVLLREQSSFKPYYLAANDCIMSEKRGSKAYDFETGKSFQFKNDAIFSYIWEKAGVSYVWQNDRFRAIVTSD